MNVQQIKLQIETVGQRIMQPATIYRNVLGIVLVSADTNTNKLIFNFNKSAAVRTNDDAFIIILHFISLRWIAMTLSRATQTLFVCLFHTVRIVYIRDQAPKFPFVSDERQKMTEQCKIVILNVSVKWNVFQPPPAGRLHFRYSWCDILKWIFRKLLNVEWKLLKFNSLKKNLNLKRWKKWIVFCS